MSHSESKPAIIAALIGNSLIAITKFIASAISGSSAMLSEGIHSLVDVSNQVLLLFGLSRSQKKADSLHPFGYGKELYFWSFIVAILLFAFGGGLSIYEGIKHLAHPEPIKNVLINYVVLLFAIVFEGYSFAVAYKQFKKTAHHSRWFQAINRAKDPALIVVLLEDSAAMLGLIIALIGISISYTFNLPIIDAMTSMIIGLVLLLVSVWLALESKNLLIGEAASPAQIRKIRTIIKNDNRISDVKNILTMHMSPQEILVNLYVDFNDELNAANIEDAISELENQIKKEIKEIGWIFIAAKSFSKRHKSS